MTKAEALERLRAREPELRQLGITRLSIFGSTARDEARPDSDVDLVATVDYDAIRALGPFGFFGIEGRIEDMLGVKVDFMTEASLEPRLQAQVDRDRVHVF
ncbi:MAG: DNA polymerase III subunit beta [Sphingomonas sp.]|jgi:predicted nucleotidyltransferase|uniref:nucleotidyltransferase family protein n=1 Tax=Sphingomonas sp. CD22 TaxID=3100214 RepID=UPI001209693A|nr:nucleotidyltransferase domain-containing protein [Sphingomonas sp. CD22]MEA1084089.1 nucleotidyltransferase domain-containing protein [Sphingomonas sp. CD22]RZM36548.1 MAG: DNA polymerase III subunit beta [Sphingomonas sp.]